MADLAHVWGQDLQLGPTGDLATVLNDNETQQRIIHRLLTASGNYFWNLDYGATLPAQVGQPFHTASIAAFVRQQIALEASVATSPEPLVTTHTTTDGTLTVTIQYADAATGSTQVLSFPVG